MKVKLLSRVRLLATPWTSLPGSSVHGIFQARVLEWIAISFSRDLPDPGIEPGSPALRADALQSEPPGKLKVYEENLKRSHSQFINGLKGRRGETCFRLLIHPRPRGKLML